MVLGGLVCTGISDKLSHTRPPESVTIQQAQEDSLKQQSYHLCNKALPGIRYKVAELVERAPGRWQAIRRNQHDQIVCTAWQGQVVGIDTAIIQPGNGVITR